MLEEQEDVFYYLTLMNENYLHASMPAGAEEGIVRGMYLVRPSAGQKDLELCACSRWDPEPILREALAAAELLERIGTSGPMFGA